jgi:hypothetical protein
MKQAISWLLLGTFLMMSCCVYGAPIPRRHPSPVIRHKPSLHKVVTWKKIAAGGAAAGTVIAAYKISDGVEDGLRTAAEKDPGAFMNFLDRFVRPFRWILYLLSGGLVVFLYLKFKRK